MFLGLTAGRLCDIIVAYGVLLLIRQHQCFARVSIVLVITSTISSTTLFSLTAGRGHDVPCPAEAAETMAYVSYGRASRWRPGAGGHWTQSRQLLIPREFSAISVISVVKSQLLHYLFSSVRSGLKGVAFGSTLGSCSRRADLTTRRQRAGRGRSAD